MKKIIALFLAAAVFVLAGCSDTNKDYSVLLPFVNGSTNDKSTNDKIEVTLAFVNNDSRMITGNPGASTAEAYDVDSGKYIKVKITDKNETPLCEEKIDIKVQETGKISLYIDKVNFNNLKAATVTVTGYTKAEDGTHQEFTKGTLKDVDITLGKTIYVPMEYIITEGEAGPSGNITFTVGYNSQADWEKNGFDVSEVGETAVFEVSYAPLNGGANKILNEQITEDFNENGFYVKNDQKFIKFRIEDKSGYYKLKVTWKNCPVIVNGIKITQPVEMIIANDNIFCIPDYDSVTINTNYETKFNMPVKKLWAVNGTAAGTAAGDGESMASPASLSSLLSQIASDDKYKLYSINCSNIATKIYGDGGYYLFDAYMYDATSINNITCNAEKYINIKSTDLNASMVIKSNEGESKMIAVANESIAVTKSGDEEAFLPAELQPKSETDYATGATTEYFDFILEKGAKVDILNTDFNPNGINVYADDNYHIYQETDNYTTYDQWSSCCFARQEIGIDATTTDALDNTKCKIYIYNSTDKTYVRNYSVVIGTTNQYTADNLKRYKLFYLKQSL